tara:strand:- start:5393 stop:6298 length:906 start_codon:yes stop_codon:yes gene_type:complete
MAVTRVHSSDSQVFVNDIFGFETHRLPLLQSLTISTNKDFTDLQPLGKYCYDDRILNSNQTTTVELTHLVSTGVSGFYPSASDGYPFYALQNQARRLISIDSYKFKAADNAGETLVTGAYPTSYELRGAVGDVVSATTNYDADTVTFNAEGALTSADDFPKDLLADLPVFRPQDISITTTAGLESEAMNSASLNIQDFTLSADISREPRKRIGSRVPSFRYPTLPANGSLNFSVIKNQVTGINMTNLVLDQGTIKIDLKDNAGTSMMDFVASGCSLESVSQSLGVGDNETMDFSYIFSIEY